MTAGGRNSWRWSIAAALLLASSGGAAATATPMGGAVPEPNRPRCATPARAHGGDWTSSNGDLHNTRNQRAEDRIGTANAAALEPAWSFDGASVDPELGGTRSTPVVAYGCVYVAFGMGYLGDRGDVVALNVDTGELVWHRKIDGSVLGLTAANGMVYVTPSLGTRGETSMPVVTEDYAPAGSYALALDARSGAIAWKSERLDDGTAKNGTFVNASPVVFQAGKHHLLFVPLAGGGGDGAKVPMYFIDARTGRTVRKGYALSEAEYAAGFGGTGVWSTAAYDESTQHLYVGTADSDGHTRQHPYNNALLRIDANPTRPTFASVVGSYAGTSEHFDVDRTIDEAELDADLFEQNPACGSQTTGVDPPTFFDTSASPTCLELDLDFGASPNLYRDADGVRRVGALQKSGYYHSVRADDMTGEWTFSVGPGGAAMDAATAAIDGDQVLVAATPNLLFGLDAHAGDPRWIGTTDLDLFSYQPVTVANRVLFTVNDSGFLVGFDASNGVPLLRRSIADDGGFEHCLGVGAGVAVARHTVFAPCDAGGPSDLAGLPSPPGGLVAYRLPR